MPGLVLDTHAALWYLTADARLPSRALAAIQDSITRGERCLVPAVCIVEVVYLVEKGRIPRDSLQRIVDALNDRGSGLAVAPLDVVVGLAVAQIPRQQVPDMPDRVIAATAIAYGLPLITRDSNIRVSGAQTIW